MKSSRAPFVCSLCVAAVLASTAVLAGAERAAPARLSSASGEAFTDAERQAFVSRVLSRPEVRALTAGHRTRVLRVWSDTVKGEKGVVRRDTVLLRDYDAGIAREIAVEQPAGRIQMRELAGVQPSPEEIEEGMSIARRDPALASFVENPRLLLIGGFHNRSSHRDDPCSVEVCLEFAFMRPNYEGPARYIVVNLSRGVVANHDFRGGRPGKGPPRMTKEGNP